MSRRTLVTGFAWIVGVCLGAQLALLTIKPDAVHVLLTLWTVVDLIIVLLVRRSMRGKS